jgi:hypothetical protein
MSVFVERTADRGDRPTMSAASLIHARSTASVSRSCRRARGFSSRERTAGGALEEWCPTLHAWRRQWAYAVYGGKGVAWTGDHE